MKREFRGKKFRSDERSAARFREVGEALYKVHRLPREVLRKRDRHCTSTKFRFGVMRRIHELCKRPLYMYVFILEVLFAFHLFFNILLLFRLLRPVSTGFVQQIMLAYCSYNAQGYIHCLDQWYSTGGTRRHLRGYVKFKISIYILFNERSELQKNISFQSEYHIYQGQ
jgi:hypothetical protein